MTVALEANYREEISPPKIVKMSSNSHLLLQTASRGACPARVCSKGRRSSHRIWSVFLAWRRAAAFVRLWSRTKASSSPNARAQPTDIFFITPRSKRWIEWPQTSWSSYGRTPKTTLWWRRGSRWFCPTCAPPTTPTWPTSRAWCVRWLCCTRESSDCSFWMSASSTSWRSTGWTAGTTRRSAVYRFTTRKVSTITSKCSESPWRSRSFDRSESAEGSWLRSANSLNSVSQMICQSDRITVSNWSQQLMANSDSLKKPNLQRELSTGKEFRFMKLSAHRSVVN